MTITARFKAAVAAFRHPSTGTTGAAAWSSIIRLPGSTKDWESKAGEAWTSSAAAIGIGWIAQSFQEARLQVVRDTPQGQEWLPDHPLSRLVTRPNPAYGGRSLMWASVVSLLADGNAYWLKVRDSRGVFTRELWYVPHWLMEPRWPANGSEYISHYDYSPGGDIQKVDPANVVHLRYGLDPENTRKGIGPLRAQLRAVAGDNEVNTYVASVMEHVGAVGVMVVNEDPDVEIGDVEAKTLKKQILAATTGDERGKPIIVPSRIKLERLGLNPEQMALDKMASFPVARIMGALHLSAMAVGLPDEARTYNNFAEAKRAAWENGVLPVMGSMADDVEAQMLPEFPPTAGLRMQFDTRQVLALQDDVDKRHTRARANYIGGIWTRAEARIETGKEAAPDDEVYREASAAPVDAGGSPAPPVGKAQAISAKDAELIAGQPSEMETWLDRCVREIEAVAGYGSESD